MPLPLVKGLVIDRVMQTYGMLVRLAPEEEEAIRVRVVDFLRDKTGDDRILTMEAIKFLRGTKLSQKGRVVFARTRLDE